MGEKTTDSDRMKKVRRFVTERHLAGEYVYPDAVRREAGTKTKETYLILEELSKEGIVNPVYASICPVCGKTAEIYGSLNSVPEQEACICCDSEFAVNIESLRVLYRKCQ